MDRHTKDTRSYNMSQIHDKDTMPEEIVRKFLFKDGLRYRKNVKKLPGCPDIVLPKYKTVIFINGCFWHKHEGCPYFIWPKTNYEFWEKKIKGNVERDIRSVSLLKTQGWNVIIVWGCELRRDKREWRLNLLLSEIRDYYM
jgi:DNA mismatch endonuclease, patch repair protein